MKDMFYVSILFQDNHSLAKKENGLREGRLDGVS